MKTANALGKTSLIFQLLFIFVAAFCASDINAQSINVTSVTGTFCPGAEVTVKFTANSGSGINRYGNSSILFAYISSSNGGAPYSMIDMFTVQHNFGGDHSVNTNVTKTLTLPSSLSAGSSYRISIGSLIPYFNAGSGAGASPLFQVAPPVIGGSVAEIPAVCPGGFASDITLTGFTGTVVKWQRATNANFTNAVNINVASPILPGSALGVINAKTYVRAQVQVCSTTYSSTGVIELSNETVWTGASSNKWHDAGNWTCKVPTDESVVIIPSGSVVVKSDAEAYSLTLLGNASVVVESKKDMTLQAGLSVAPTASFRLENYANLMQSQNVQNSGSIIVERETAPLKRQDYILWSSPVMGQKLLDFSPLTITTRFYTYNHVQNLYNAIANPATTEFEQGKGYLIRVPNTHPTAATKWMGEFQGVPNNGNITVALSNSGYGKRLNLVGNPYPSPISMSQFVLQNLGRITGTLYFWRKTNGAATPAYAVWAAGTFISNGNSNSQNPNNVIQTGQGFFVEAFLNSTSVEFRNSMRVANNSGQFFREQEEDLSRIWLNATDVNGVFSQMAIVYAEGAQTNAVDMYDGRYNNDGEIALTTEIEGDDYVINGRSTFDASDVVPLRFYAATAGNYTLSVDHVDGIFSEGQPVLLKDNLTGDLINLGEGAYAFNADAGFTHGRFEIQYQMPLGNGHVVANTDAIVTMAKNGHLTINGGNLMLENVEVFDIRGAKIATRNNIDAQTATLDVPSAAKVLIVKVTTQDNQVVTKKIMN